LIGEHTDYNEGYVFPAAIDLYVLGALRKAPKGITKVVSNERGDMRPVTIATAKTDSSRGWVKFVTGMARSLREAAQIEVPDIELMLVSNLPIGAGVSSSAALEMLLGVAWLEMAGKSLPRVELAKVGQYCENKFVGVQCGIMDQLACICGVKDHALLIDTRDLTIHPSPIPNGIKIVICNTMKQRSLHGSAFNERQSQCRQAATILEVPSLREADLSLLEASREQLGDLLYRRARHVITENARCLSFLDNLSRLDLNNLGTLMKESHVSLRGDYEVSCRELDVMAELCWSFPDCIGARMTGAGFGGACVALVGEDSVEHFVKSTGEKYERIIGTKPTFTACKAVDGAGISSL
jgi:galactokinase